MTENVSRFFEQYDHDPALRARVEEAVACYPGSLEIRLRAYETRKKLSRIKPDVQIEEGEEDEDADFEGYWLLDHGWEHDESVFKK